MRKCGSQSCTFRNPQSAIRILHSCQPIRTSRNSSSSPAPPASANRPCCSGCSSGIPTQLRLSVSATTRPPRPGERTASTTISSTPEEFARRRQAGEFLECCEVFGRGHWYGTLLERSHDLAANDQKWVILDIDVDGAEKVRGQFPDVPTIFLRPSSEAELERRLRARGTETEEAIQRRLEVARRELARADQYQFQVVNDTVDRAVTNRRYSSSSQYPDRQQRRQLTYRN